MASLGARVGAPPASWGAEDGAELTGSVDIVVRHGETFAHVQMISFGKAHAARRQRANFAALTRFHAGRFCCNVQRVALRWRRKDQRLHSPVLLEHDANADCSQRSIVVREASGNLRSKLAVWITGGG